MTPADVRQQVIVSRRRQGLPAVIEDELLLSLLAAELVKGEAVTSDAA